ncbi:DUF4132 domain-containing protein [Novosphingobium sp. B 225]|uniref:DUF4132 domain-containing protein n=1 Tax=Novosphingobium sp. B 225 TaxID=1961849 RepID=UPI000B4A859A|nr:DUF4132 domain-containing protein [Novosphingobium sp. B 225]
MSFFDKILGRINDATQQASGQAPRPTGGFGRRTAPPQVPSGFSQRMEQWAKDGAELRPAPPQAQPQAQPQPQAFAPPPAQPRAAPPSPEPASQAKPREPLATRLAVQVISHFSGTALASGFTAERAGREFGQELLKTQAPAHLLCELAASLHGLMVPLVFREAREPNLRSAYIGVMNAALDHLDKRAEAVWPVTGQQLALVLDNYLRIVPHLRIDQCWSTEFLALVLQHAALDAQLRPKAIEMIDALCRSEANGFINMLRFIDSATAGAGIDRTEVPTMRKWDRQGTEVTAVRAELFAQAGPLLGPALEYTLDDGKALYGNRAAFPPALKTLLGGDKTERGAALSFLLSYIVTPRGYDNLAYLGKVDGRWSHCYGEGNRGLPKLDSLAYELAKGAIELPDPDRDHARLVWLLGNDGKHHKETSRQILRELIKTVSRFPDGATAKELALLVGRPEYAAWAGDVETAIRGNPIGTAAAPVAPEALPPLDLPPFEIGYYQHLDKFERHFGNLMEPRLYTGPHDALLGKLIAIADAGQALPEGPARNQLVLRLLREGGIANNYTGQDDPFAGSYLGCFLDRARMLHDKREALRPFAETRPEVLRHLAGLAQQIETKSEPPAKWIKDARAVFALLPPELWVQQLARITAVSSPYAGMFGVTGEQHIRTLIYIAHLLPADQVGSVLADYALKQCYVTRKGAGIRCEKLGNACVWALANLPDGAGVPYLARVLARTKYPKIKARIDGQLNAAAARAGMSRAELDEITVPTHGLDQQGTRKVDFESGHALLAVSGADAELRWFNAAGTELKGPSAAMKAEKETYKELRDDLKDLQADLSIQPQRLQQLYLKDRSWAATQWQARYFDHPLTRALARKLVWWVEAADGTRRAALADEAGEALLDVAGQPVVIAGATIRLWHPMDDTIEAVEAWRDRLEVLQLTQPFAQVWREVYALTNAERATRTYTNRWAAHILKQHQAMTLARINGWNVTHRMWVDAPNDKPWHILIPEHGLLAEYWAEGAGGESPEVNDSAAYSYVATDRVCFYRVAPGAKDSAQGPDRGEPIPLEQVPAVVFSEVMRHCDLFTAVTSIAADPQWLDGGEDAAHPNQWRRGVADAYWRHTNTANLVESGKRRRAMLERIVPRLKFAKQLSLEANALIVQGTRHRYEIHLGSGACSRGGRHICIVPKSSVGADRIWLPFEGDRTLSIILSKALLLAQDDKITDPVILAQL